MELHNFRISCRGNSLLELLCRECCFDDFLLFIADTKSLYRIVQRTARTLRVRKYHMKLCDFKDVSVVFQNIGHCVFWLQWEKEPFLHVEVLKGFSRYENMYIFDCASFDFDKALRLEDKTRINSGMDIRFVSDFEEDEDRTGFDGDVGCLNRCYELSNGLSKDYYKPFFIHYLQKVKRHPRYEELIQKYPYALHIIGMMNERIPTIKHTECLDCLNNQHSDEENEPN